MAVSISSRFEDRPIHTLRSAASYMDIIFVAFGPRAVTLIAMVWVAELSLSCMAMVHVGMLNDQERGSNQPSEGPIWTLAQGQGHRLRW